MTTSVGRTTKLVLSLSSVSPQRLFRNLLPARCGVPVHAILLSALFFLAAQEGVLSLDFDAKVPPTRTESFETSGILRGFGALSAKGYLWNQPSGGERSVVEIQCESPEKANITASKYIADMLGYGATKRVELPEKNAVGIDVQGGGQWAVGLQGSSVIIAQASNAEELTSFLKTLKADRWSLPDGKYPRYLDNFDNASLSIWCASNSKSQAGIDFMARNNLTVRLDASSGSPTQSYAPGVVDMAGIRNVKALADVLGTGYKFSGCIGRGNTFPRWFQPGGWSFLADSIPYFTEPRGDFDYYRAHFQDPEGMLVLQSSYLQILQGLAKDPDLLEWMDPHGERTLRLWRQPPGWKTNYPLFLKEKKGYTLAQVSELYTGSPDTYASWSDVPYPDLAEFYGRRGKFDDLDDVKWRWRMDSPKKLEGIEAGWWKPDFDDSSWSEDFRTNPRTMGDKRRITNSPNTLEFLWYRFSDQGQPELAKEKKVWLHIMPFSNRRPLRPISIWVNGELVVKDFVEKDQIPLIEHMRFDVTPYLKETPNQYTILFQDSIHYRVWLSDQDSNGYPTEDEKLNRRWVDWLAYLVDEQMVVLESYLRLIRSVDPDRPIKVMAPDKGMLSNALEIFERYGAYPHLTGENPRQYRPENFKAFTALRGMPSTSEPGQPVKTAQEAQALFANILWESQDNHDYGFDLDRNVMTQPEVVEWFDQNKQTLSTLGKTSLSTPKIGVLFDIGQGTLYNQGAGYLWNLGRGPLSQAGYSFVFLTAQDLIRGRGKDIPVIIDSATQVMSPEGVRAVREYVVGGGTFIAMHLSGKDSEEKPGTWPLLNEFGFTVKADAGKLPLTFTKEQDLFPELKGQAVKQPGVSIDFLGNSQSGNVAVETTDKTDASPIALWEDGSMAIAERRVGKGRFVFFGAPVYFRARDEEGKWIGEQEQQALLKSMLHQLGVDPQVGSSDSEVWTDLRESKNGLYEVLFAARMVSAKDSAKESKPVDLWYVSEEAISDSAIEVTAVNEPAVSLVSGAGRSELKALTMEPKQIRQFVFLRKDVGLEGPMHWLKFQSEFWRPVESVPASEALAVAEEFEAKYPKSQAQDISFDWKVRAGGESDPAWTEPGFNDESWKTGSLGAWFEHGWQDETRVSYRKDVTIPKEWEGKQIILGFELTDSTFDRGATPTSQTKDGKYIIGSSMDYEETISVLPTMQLWIQGKSVLSRTNYHAWAMDVTDLVKNGRLDLAFDVTGTSLCRGPAGTMYLWSTPKPVDQISLDESWTKLNDWWKKSSEKVTVGQTDKEMGWRTKVKIPADWKGGQVYLVVEEPNGLLKSPYPVSVYNVFVNGDAQFSSYLMAPVGVRIDGALKPGEENTIELIFPNGGKVTPTATRLELYRGFGTLPANARLSSTH